MFLNFNIRNFEFSKYRSFYILLFQIVIPTQLSNNFTKFWIIEN